MTDTLEKVTRFIERLRLLEGAEGVLVAVSGGPDSVALLDILVRLRPAVALHVAHLDHMLRGKESAEDARFVRALAKRLGLKSTVRKADVRKVAKESGRGVEEIAREVRYKFLLRTAQKAGCDRIATGHTMSDQAETLLMRLARGSGLRGLVGMRPMMQAHLFEGEEWESGRVGEGESGREGEPDTAVPPGFHSRTPPLSHSSRPVSPSPPLPFFPSSPRPLLIRPLLCITREEVASYCRVRELPVRIDQTNLSADFTRNRVRNEVLPALREVNSHVVEHIAGTAEIIADDQDALDQLASSLVDRARQSRALADDATARSAYSVAALRSQPAGIRRRMIIKAIELARANVVKTEPHEQIDRTHIEAVDALIANGMSGSRIMLPGAFEVWLEFDCLVFMPSISRTPASGADSEEWEYMCEISLQAPLARAGGLDISLVRGQPGDLLQPAIEQARREKKALGHDWLTAVLDDRLLPERLIVRPRLRGERARVLGHEQTKKLKNLMIDHRIPTSRRAIWPIVATPDGQYVWSPGLPPADEFAARDETHGLAILRASGV
ncbi:MAG TPA: tRNA lysidine(34) synthetase TilS [Blastocatellia bacterium]|nr:tRNA lysidine(34) synthetase TilS [Blastocatellia bacterium]